MNKETAAYGLLMAAAGILLYAVVAVLFSGCSNPSGPTSEPEPEPERYMCYTLEETESYIWESCAGPSPVDTVLFKIDSVFTPKTVRSE